MCNEVSAAFCSGRRDDQCAPGPFERAHHGNLVRLSWSRNPQVGTTLGPGTRKIWMRQCFALIAE